MVRYTFSDLSMIPKTPGVYRLYTHLGTFLKVGESVDLRSRLSAHKWSNYDKSVLARHMYVDKTLPEGLGYNFTNQHSRRQFLLEQCYFTIELTASKVESQRIEGPIERSGAVRYAIEIITRKFK